MVLWRQICMPGKRIVFRENCFFFFCIKLFCFFHRSIFGEDALANLSIEKSLESTDSTVTGHIRIRAKSQVSFTFIFCLVFICLNIDKYFLQGMALSLGDKINSSQKATQNKVAAA